MVIWNILYIELGKAASALLTHNNSLPFGILSYSNAYSGLNDSLRQKSIEVIYVFFKLVG